MLLQIENLNVVFATRRGSLHAVRDLSLCLQEGETLGIVGESGCGKSITSLAIMGLLPPNAQVNAERMTLVDHDLQRLTEQQFQRVRGKDVAMIFQDPMSSLNPSFTVGFQLAETLKAHEKIRGAALRDRMIKLLRQVGLPSPEMQLSRYPHQLSGGMSQRVMIAMAVACRPRLLIADEPTTALDVTIQAQILALLQELQREYGMGLILITHDLGVVNRISHKLAVMYAGEVVESGLTHEIIRNPRHPYTAGLLNCLPEMHWQEAENLRLPSIPGLVPDLVHRPAGCQFHPRCPRAQGDCRSTAIPLRDRSGRLIRCLYPMEVNLP